MRKFYSLIIALVASLTVSAQTVIDISAIDAAYTKTVDAELVIDVATTASKLESPKLWYANPFKGKTFTEAEISFDVYNYYGTDSIKVLGSLLAFYDNKLGRMYFSNGSYLGYNATGGWFDANLKSYGIDSNFIGGNTWKNIKLKFSAAGYAMYIDNVLAFNHGSKDITIGGTLADYNNVITFLQNADTLVFGTGSWWSDNSRPGGSYYDLQYSYLKNITFNSQPPIDKALEISAIDTAYTKTVDAELVVDVATTASKLASPKLWYVNPFKGKTFTEAEVSFDVYNYNGTDSIKVLGSLLAFYDAALGRMYFSNGSYLGYNATGGWFDVNLKSYGLDSNFIGGNIWKNIKLKFSATGYAMYVNDTLAFNNSSTDITIGGTLTDYSNVLTFLQNADTLVIGTGSWWSDNTRPGGSYYDLQYSYLKNITFSSLPPIDKAVEISAIDTAYTKTVDAELVVDVATTASKLASPKLWYVNPFKGKAFTEAEVSFDVYNYHGTDSIKVLGSLIAFYDKALGRMYFSNGSYLGYNATGGWFDANLISYGIGTDFIGGNIWKNIKLKFSATGYTMYVNDTLAFNNSSTDITIGGTLTDYSNVLTFLQSADTLVIGTGSWWSDNTRPGGNYYDLQYSYLKNIKFNTVIPVDTVVDISLINTDYTKTVDEELVIDVATTASKLASPKLWFANPFKGKTFTLAEVSFDVYNYHGIDSIKVLGSLIAFYDAVSGRMYFSNGSYLGYNATGGWFDANLISYGIGTDFIGGNTWKNIKLQYTTTGYAIYVDNTLAFDQSSTNVTIGGTVTDYTNVITYLQNADTLVIGTGSWWSDNTRGDGSYFDLQYSYLKNIKFHSATPPVSAIDQTISDTDSELVGEEFFNINGQKVGSDFNTLKAGIYIKRSIYSNGAIKSTKIVKFNDNFTIY
jgi:hypothetical protein